MKTSFASGRYEPFETQIVSSLINDKDVVIDVGSHVGYYSLVFSRWVGKEGKVISVEPDPDNFLLLEENIKYNCCSNVQTVNRAAYNCEKEISLYKSESNSGDNRTWKTSEERKAVPIRTIKIDDLVTNGEYPSLIKIDTQGSEFQIIQGMHKILTSYYPPDLVLEYWPWGIIQSGMSPHHLLLLLLNLQYKIFVIDEVKKRIGLVTDYRCLLSNWYNEHMMLNFVCVKDPHKLIPCLPIDTN